MAWKTLRRDVSYNLACSIMDANRYLITDTKEDIKHGWTAFYSGDRLVARYHEPSGRLQVITG